MKYFKHGNEVYAFESDGSQDNLITDAFIEMSAEEIDRYINPQKYLSDEEKEKLRLSQFKSLTRRQFKLVLLEAGLLDQIESEINAINDSAQRARIQIEYTEAAEFRRTNDSVKYMCQLLGLTDQQVDEMWIGALAL